MTLHQTSRRHSRYLTLAEVGECLNLKRWRLIDLIKAGELHAIKLGTARSAQYRVSEEALADFIERHKVKTPAAS